MMKLGGQHSSVQKVGKERGVYHMKIVICHGQNHKGSTYHIARALADKIGGEITEFFLPRDFGEYCVGCGNCFMKGEEKCPHYDKIRRITEAIDESDVIILDSPVYVYHATGAMKVLLDHYGYRWMVHRPSENMFHKQGVVISTAAGAGMKSTNQDMADSLFFWGVPKIYRYGKAVAALRWEDVSDKTKEGIDRKISAIASSIQKNHGVVKPGLKTRVYFAIMRQIQKKGMMSPQDRAYWSKKGWLEKKRPWK